MITVEDFFGHQRAEERDRMADAALFDGGGDDSDVAEAGQLALHRGEAGRVDAVVVGEQNLHEACGSRSFVESVLLRNWSLIRPVRHSL